MGRVLTLQKFVCDTFRSKSDLKHKEIIKQNDVYTKNHDVGAIGKILYSYEPLKRHWMLLDTKRTM